MSFELVTFILERTTDFWANQIGFLWQDEGEEIKTLQEKVEIAEILLKNIDEVQRKANINSKLRITVHQVMAILGEIEDFRDLLIWGKEINEEDKQSTRPSFSSLKRKRSAVKGAKEITEKLSKAIQCLEGYQLAGDSPYVIPRRRYQTQPYTFKEEFNVGLKEDVEAYVAELVAKKANQRSCTDLAIFGMGGSGKTTAARLLYNHSQISEHFDTKAWICVSQTWDIKTLLRQICSQVVPREHDDDERLLLDLKEFLQTNSCFFVLDDVWEFEALAKLLPALKSRSTRNNEGKAPSKVLVTTRNKEIFNFDQYDFSAKKIRPLTPDESKDLLLKTIRRTRGDGWSLEGGFEELGKEMLDKCRGLPLAIVALGGILSSRYTVPEWERIKADVVRKISKHKGSNDDCVAVTEILELSYFDLPCYLKPCFIYLGIFPEDSLIDVEKLIKLWIAEGFIKVDQNSSSSTLETLARDYLDELAHRCMVEVGEKNYVEEISVIQIHDLMRDLCIRKAEDLKFFELKPRPTSTSTFVDQNSCRIILHEWNRPSSDINFSLSSSIKTKKRVRSFIMGLEGNIRTGAIFTLSLEGMKYLRVLHLYKIELKDTGTQIGDLILLRHLQLQSCTVSRGHALSIKKLRNLLSFICSICTLEEEMPANLVGGMHLLRSLYLNFENLEFDLQKLQELGHCASLELIGKIRSHPHQPFGQFPRRLMKLCLTKSQIGEEEQLKAALAQLDELRCLELFSDSYNGDRLSISGLPKLQYLFLCNLTNLKEWRIECGALRKLQTLEIRQCSNLERLPQQISCITTLKRLRIVMTPALTNRLERPSENGAVGEDFFLVRHIPHLEIIG